MDLNQIALLVLILLPMAAGVLLPLLPVKTRKGKRAFVTAALVAEAVCAAFVLGMDGSAGFTLFSMGEELSVAFALDGVSGLFLALSAFGFLPVGIYAFRYLEHSEREDSFFAFFLLSQGALIGMDLAANLITMYLFFELVTLLSMPMVLHDRTEESIRAALKYLFYSVAGAFLALCCIFFLSRYCTTMIFAPGGTLDGALAAGHEKLLLAVVFLGVVGFGAKAGMYPLHGWLPTAHPVAPAPASAVLSAVITKAGVLAIFRIIYYCVGPDFLRGTWVQKGWLTLSLITVFVGSMMAYREKVLKKRLAYSSVSQISYVLTGLFLLNRPAALGGLLHVVFHAGIKICLFLVAGSFIVNLGKHRVDELRGVGKAMPKTLWCWTFASLALVGIPPFSGFVSKWYLALGALDSGLGVFDVLVPVVLLISALLTAGYLLPITINGFFPGKDFKSPEKTREGGARMWVPIALFAASALVLGLFAAPLVRRLTELVCTLL